jgi:hypothetical protein
MSSLTDATGQVETRIFVEAAKKHFDDWPIIADQRTVDSLAFLLSQFYMRGVHEGIRSAAELQVNT